MIVIEERRSFLEKNIRDALFHALPHERGRRSCRRGSTARRSPAGLAGIPETRGLNPSVLAQMLIPLIKATEEISRRSPQRPTHRRDSTASARPASRSWRCFPAAIVARTPTFCPGCPHRDSSAALLELRQNLADPKYMARASRHAARSIWSPTATPAATPC